jgi:hypothetical protein
MTENKQKYTMIGIDVAKLKLDVAFNERHLLTVDNLEDGFKQILTQIARPKSVCFVLEATGVQTVGRLRRQCQTRQGLR